MNCLNYCWVLLEMKREFQNLLRMHFLGSGCKNYEFLKVMKIGVMAIFVKMRQNSQFETSHLLLETFILMKQRLTNKSIFKEIKSL